MGNKRIWISWALALSMLTPLASCGESGKTGESGESVFNAARSFTKGKRGVGGGAQ